MDEPVFVYYQMNNFYQNHRNFVKSINEKQFRDKFDDQGSIDCGEVEKVGDLPFEWQIEKAKEAGNDEADDAIPCGIAAAYYFTDTFSLLDENGEEMIETDDIAWKSDIDDVFTRDDDSAWQDITDEHFMV